MLLVVAYDVANDRRRIRLHELLLGYGEPIQESVFECDLDEPHPAELCRRVARLVRAPDLVRYYPLCAACADRIAANGPLPPNPIDVIA